MEGKSSGGSTSNRATSLLGTLPFSEIALEYEDGVLMEVGCAERVEEEEEEEVMAEVMAERCVDEPLVLVLPAMALV